jgi:hypothetical protein
MKYTIMVDGKNYSGESADKIPADYSGNGWHTANHNELNVLVFGKDAKIITGNRGLRSELDKIMRRIEMGALIANEIIIRRENG